MKISIGSDHGGFELKQILSKRLADSGNEVLDRGNFSPEPVDYPDIAAEVSKDVVENRADRGILICGTGIGMCNSASRFRRITTALCTNSYMAKMSRLHNNANILCLGGRVVGNELAWEISKAFLENEPIMNEKYIRRRKKVDSLP